MMSKSIYQLPANAVEGFKLVFLGSNIEPTIFGGWVAHKRQTNNLSEYCFLESSPEGIAIGFLYDARHLRNSPKRLNSQNNIIAGAIKDISIPNLRESGDVNIRTKDVIIKYGCGFDHRESVVIRFITSLTENDSIESWAEEIKSTNYLRNSYRYYERFVQDWDR